MSFNEKIQKFQSFVDNQLLPDLKGHSGIRDQLTAELNEYLKLKGIIEVIQTNELKEMKTQVDLGMNFYANALVKDTKYIYVQVGFGFHVQFTLEEAVKFIHSKTNHLESKIHVKEMEISQIRTNIDTVLNSIEELKKLNLQGGDYDFDAE